MKNKMHEKFQIQEHIHILQKIMNEALVFLHEESMNHLLMYVYYGVFMHFFIQKNECPIFCSLLIHEAWMN